MLSISPHICSKVKLLLFFLEIIKYSVYFIWAIVLLVEVLDFWEHGVLEPPGPHVPKNGLIRNLCTDRRKIAESCLAFITCHYREAEATDETTEDVSTCSVWC